MTTVTLEQALAGFDREALAAIAERHPPPTANPRGPLKYLDAEGYLTRALDLLRQVGPSPGQFVLDLGSGPGWFPYVCRLAGCRVLALDRPLAFYRAMRALLDVQEVVHSIEPRASLPVDGYYDHITAFHITFALGWSADDWRDLTRTLRDHLATSGRIHLKLLRGHVAPDVLAYLRAQPNVRLIGAVR